MLRNSAGVAAAMTQSAPASAKGAGIVWAKTGTMTERAVSRIN